jgi:hypothetical protein
MGRFTVSVDVDTDSEWYLTSASFEVFTEALEHATGIAIWLHGEASNPPGIWIHGRALDEPASYPREQVARRSPPFSSHFVARTIPEPSKTSSFKRSDRFGSEDINVTAVGLAA